MKQMLMKFLGSYFPILATRLLYFKAFHKMLRLKKPINLNEKIQWLKFYGDTTMWPFLADKYLVRTYVEEKGLEDILVKLYGKYDNSSSIVWDQLPDKFVIKTNNGCGDVYICNDKSTVNIKSLSDYYDGLLKTKFGLETVQLHYKLIQPCIIIEELLDISKQSVISDSLIDYKFWCINGEPLYVFVCRDRSKDHVKVSLYDINWIDSSEYLIYSDEFLKDSLDIPRPNNLDFMIECSRKLSEGHPQMRVDLYEVNNHVYFGELTLTSACGLMTYFNDEFLEKLGSIMNIEQKIQ